MSVSFNNGDAYPGALVFGMSRCFYCAGVVEEAAVSWEGVPPGDDWWDGGGGHRLILHPHRVYALVARLLRDVHEYECRTNVHPIHESVRAIRERKNTLREGVAQ